MKKILLTMSMACLTIAGFNAQLNRGKIQALSTAAKALTVTDAEVQDAAAASVKWMDEHNATCSTKDKDKKKKAYADRLEKIFGPYKNYDGLKLNYKVYYVIDVNAFASPDGSVRVFSSLMDMMTDDEILGIIGHEIGHVKLGHSKKAYKQALLTAAAAKYAGSTSGSVADLVSSDLGDIATKLTSAQFSQTQESSADDYAYTFMVANGKDPHALATAFEKIAKLEKEAGADKSTGAKIFSSHPDSEKRVKRVENKIKKDSKK